MRGTLRIGKIAGIEIGVHYTWIFALVLFAWIFAQNTLPAISPGQTTMNYWIAGTLVSLLIFVSVLIHELCHSLVAIHRGIKVGSIVFFIFGGVSNIEKEPETARVEFLMAGAGPLSSIILGFIFIGIALLLQQNTKVPDLVIESIFLLGWTNILLAAFNIIPGFPLDGGRVLRSIIWGATNNLHKATVIAGNVGRLFGWAMVLLGIALIFGKDIWIFQGGLVNGIWLIFIGWFLSSAADNSMREQAFHRQLTGVKVKDVMDRSPECVSPAASVESIVQGSFISRGRHALPVCTDQGLVGIVTLADVKRLPQDTWNNTPVQEIMTRSPLLSVDQEEDINRALQILAKNGLNQIPVLNGTQFVGLLSRSDVIRYMQTRQELGMKNA